MRTKLAAVVADQIQGNVRVNTIVVGRGVAVEVTAAAGVEAVDAVAAVADRQQQTSRREVVLAVAAEPKEVGLEARPSLKEVSHALAARLGIADQAAARNLRETDRRVVKSARGVALIVTADQRRVGQRVARSRNGAVHEAMMIVRTVVLQARKKLPEVVLLVVRSHAKVDQEVLRVPRKAGLLVAANQNSLARTAERVAVVRLALVKKRINMEVVRRAGTKSPTEEMTVGRSLLHASGATAGHVAQLSRSLMEVVKLVVKLIAHLQLVAQVIRINSILPKRMRTEKRQEVVASHLAIAKTRTGALRVKKKVVQQSTRVTVGQPVRRRVVVVPSLEAQRKLEVEAVLEVMARIDAEMVQEVAVRLAFHQVRVEAEREVVVSQPSVKSQKVVRQALRRPRIVVAHQAMRKTRTEAARQVRTKMTIIKQKCRALKGRSYEAVHVKILRAVTELVEAVHAVHLVLVAGHHLLANHAGKATRNRVANLPIKTEICTLLPDIVTVE